jgi:hypothetical protein
MTAARERRNRHAPAVPVEEAVAEPVALGSHVDRLTKLFNGLVPTKLDHSNCEHEVSNAARRQCRKEKIDAARAAGGGTLVRVIDGEEYIPLLAVRAEALHIADRNGHCDDGLNATFARLNMPATNRGEYGGNNGARFDVMLEVEMPFTAQMTRAQVQSRVRDLNASVSTRITIELTEFRTVDRTQVVMEGEVEVSRETKSVAVILLHCHGRYNFMYESRPRTPEAKTADFIQWMNNRSRLTDANAKIVRATEESWPTAPDGGVDDAGLLEAYRRLSTADRHSY